MPCPEVLADNDYISHIPLRLIASLVSYSSWLFFKIPSQEPFHYLTPLLRCCDGWVRCLPCLSVGKTTLWPGKNRVWRVFSPVIFLRTASLSASVGVDKQLICGRGSICTVHVFLSKTCPLKWCLLISEEMTRLWVLLHLFVKAAAFNF